MMICCLSDLETSDDDDDFDNILADSTFHARDYLENDDNETVGDDQIN